MSKMNDRILVIGATGMLGQALMAEGAERHADIIGLARSGADINIDIRNDEVLSRALGEVQPSIVINAAAITSLDACEGNPGNAYAVNARAVSIISEATRCNGAYLVQISTDHYYVNEGLRQHAENDPVYLINEYARTKYAGECFALVSGNSLVVRTNIVGFRGRVHAPTFVEWALQGLREQSPITLFDDFYTSSIDVGHFSRAVFDLLPSRPVGVLNLASSVVKSKKEFVAALAMAVGLNVDHCDVGSVKTLSGMRRAESLGLDVSKAEALLGYSLPDMGRVIDNLAHEYRQRTKDAV